MGRNAAGVWLTVKRSLMLNGFAALSCLVCPAVSGDESENDTPDDAFLEFLGTWENSDGEWIDPLALADIDASRQAAGTGDDQQEDVGEENNDDS